MSKTKPYMCLNCTNEKGMVGFKFRSEKPVCPKCTADGSQKQYAAYIVRCVEIHYDPPHPVLKQRGLNKRLCDGKSIFENQKFNMGSGLPHAATCPDCLAHPDFPKDIGEIEVDEEADFQL